MRLGILTFYSGPNYGGYWQARALQNYLLGLGYHAEMIPYLNRTHLQNIRFQPWHYRRPLRFIHDWRKVCSIYFSRQRSGWENPSSDPHRIRWDKYDTIVVGSDVVWNFRDDGFGHEKIYFGCIKYRRPLNWISYAPSIGSMDESFPLPPECRLSLASFSALSVRDEPTARFVRRNIGQDPPVLVDPTWLPSPHPARNPPPSRSPQNILLVYAPTLWKKTGLKAKFIIDFARRHNLRIVANGIYQPWADKNIFGASPESWAEAFRFSRFAVCGTFHGALFSIRERIPFVCLSTAASAAKLSTPLQKLGLANRWLPEEESHRLGEVLEQPIIFDDIERLRMRWVDESAGWLKNALQHSGGPRT